MRALFLPLLLCALRLTPLKFSATALSVDLRVAQQESDLWRRQGFVSLGNVDPGDGSVNATGDGNDGNNIDTGDDGGDDSDDNVNGIETVPLPGFVLAVGGANASSAPSNPADQNARRGLSGLTLSYSTKAIRSSNNVTLFSVPVQGSVLRQALQEIQATAQAQTGINSSDHVQANAENLSMVLFSATSNPAQNITDANVAQVAGVFLRVMDREGDANITATFVGVIKDAQKTPLINLAVVSNFMTVSVSAEDDGDENPLPVSFPGVDETELSRSGRALQTLSANQVQHRTVLYTGLQLQYTQLSLTAAATTMIALIRQIRTEINSCGKPSIPRTFTSIPSAGLALVMETIDGRDLSTWEADGVFHSIMRAVNIAAKNAQSKSINLIQGIIVEAADGTSNTGQVLKAIGSWYFEQIPVKKLGGSSGWCSAANCIGVKDEL